MTALERAFDPAPIVRAGFLILAAGIVLLGGWAVLAPLSGAVIAPGFVKIDLNRKVVQHQEGGIVSAIRVRDGDRVKAGQELILLDDVRVDAQLDLLRTQYDTERAKAQPATEDADGCRILENGCWRHGDDFDSTRELANCVVSRDFEAAVHQKPSVVSSL